MPGLPARAADPAFALAASTSFDAAIDSRRTAISGTVPIHKHLHPQASPRASPLSPWRHGGFVCSSLGLLKPWSAQALVCSSLGLLKPWSAHHHHLLHLGHQPSHRATRDPSRGKASLCRVMQHSLLHPLSTRSSHVPPRGPRPAVPHASPSRSTDSDEASPVPLLLSRATLFVPRRHLRHRAGPGPSTARHPRPMPAAAPPLGLADRRRGQEHYRHTWSRPRTRTVRPAPSP